MDNRFDILFEPVAGLARLAELSEDLRIAVPAGPVVDRTHQPVEGQFAADGQEDHSTAPW